MKVSKELLSEVLSYKLPYKIKVHKIIVRNGTLNYFYNIKDNCGGLFEANAYINIYELAFKLKEWAYSNCCELVSYTEGCEIFQTQLGETIKYFYAETEVEAIILASEWVLKEINEKQLQH